jgi:Arc/MetJ family transcription regulator
MRVRVAIDALLLYTAMTVTSLASKCEVIELHLRRSRRVPA